MRIILLLSLLMIGFSSSSQSQRNDAKTNTIFKSYDSALSVHLKKWNVYEVATAELFNQLQQSENENQVHLDWGIDHDWQLSLFPNNLRSADYEIRTATGEMFSKSANKTFEGFEQSLGGEVRLTVDVDFIYGYIESGGERYFIEPVWYYDKSAPRNLFVVYDEHEVIPRDDVKCASHEMHKRAEKLENHDHDHDQKQNQGQENLVGLCYDVELAIASDHSMFLKYNSSITDVENHNLGVLNNVQGNYDDEFADELNFVVVTQFISNCNTCDPWPTTTNGNTLLSEFRNWGNGGGFGVVYDLAQLWTDRDIFTPNSGNGVIGIAYLFAVCNNNRYQIDEDFSSTAWQLRVLVSHETGHNFNASHDAANSGFIMAPSVNNSNTWSNTSVNSINAFVDTRTCLAECAAPVPPTASFISNIQNICEGSQVQFFDQSVGIVNSRVWSFTGGFPASSTAENPIITYQNSGTYPVSLTVTNGNGSNSQNQSGYITVGPGGTNIILFDAFEDGLGNWTIENPNGNTTWASAAVGGTNLGSTAAYMDNYNLNQSGQRDGLVSQSMSFEGFTNVNLSLDYAYALYNGNTNLRDSLIIKLSTDGGNTFPNTLFEGGDNGNGSFATTPPQGEFNPTSTANWCYGGSFGAGCINLDLSSFINQTNVVLKLENVNGFGNNLYLDNITVSSDCEVILPPVADFTASQTQGCVPMTVNFTDLSINTPSSWFWTFPGGIPSSSTQQNPTIIYNTPGVYDVTLVSTNSAGSNTKFQGQYIQVEDVPTSNFSYTANGTMFIFTNLSIGGTSFTWLFGDGNTSNEENPVHDYGTGGTYEVSLIVTNNCGVMTSVQTIVIETQPVAGFDANPTSGCSPLEVQFNDQSSSNVTAWLWNFPGGTPSTSMEQNPLVTYNSPGVYSVDLTVTNASGSDMISQTDYITVNDVPSANFTQVTNGLTVDFTNTSTNANSYSWDFGDGNTSTETNPSHTYSGDGNYDVVLTATNDCGSVTSSQSITISTLPSANFEANVTSGCAALTVQFNDLSSSNTTSWSWSFPGGNPSTSTEQNPSIGYNSAGVYSVTLIASNSTGDNTITLTNYITVDDVPSVGFSQMTNGLMATFTNTSINANSYSWDFGDGNISTETNPTHTYGADGNYTVVLTATNNCGSVTSTQTVNISNAPSAGFGANVTSGCASLTVQFSDQSSSNTTSWNWSFPGGNPSSSTEQNPSVTYDNAGTYSVTLEAINATGNSIVTQTDFILVNDVPTASFSQNINGLNVDFTNTSTNGNSYNWDFGDGNSSTDLSPSHTYGMDGTYEVILSVTNNCGTVTTMTTVTIVTSPTAGFGANVTNGCADLTVQFSDQSSTNATSWNWSFIGGNPSSSTEQNPTVTYENAGTYSVILTVTNAAGNNQVEQMNYIVVDDIPVAGFTADANAYNVDFTNTSTNATSYNWDFGDGNTSAETNPSHTYVNDGMYDVVLIATNSCGSITFTQTINISNTPTANWTSGPSVGCTPLTIQFQNQSSNNSTSWEWTFDGGTPSTSTEQSPTVVYNNSGTFSVSLVAINNQGTDTTTMTDYVVVNTTPSTAFSSNVNGPLVNFNNQSTNANSYSWNFGDGGTSNEQNPSHQYSLNGEYTVTLSATNDCGTTTITQTVSITSSVIAGFSSSVASGCLPLEVQFMNESTNATSFEWTFTGGNPSNSTMANPIVSYPNAGVYTVMLTASNSTGSSTVIETGYIIVEGVPFASFGSDVNGLTVDFTNFSSLGDTFLWSFGDGNISAETNPQHTYLGIGIYTVTLTATNDCGSNIFTIDLDVGTAVSAGFFAEDTEGCAPMQIQFTDQSSDNVSGWNWSFPGGTPATSSEQNPLVNYNTPGVYEVTLEVSNPFNSSTVTETNYITILDVPTANFTFNETGNVINYNNTSTNADTYLWTFGDGETSMDENPSHTYVDDGNYTVTLEATNVCGTVVTQEIISIVTPVSVGFTADVTNGCSGLEVQFTDASSNNVTGWNWTFAGGTPNTSTEQNPTVIYNTPGTYSVVLEVNNSGFNAMQTEMSYIVIAETPTASFTSMTTGGTVDFTNTSTNATNYFWTFGDGETSMDENPSHTYTSDGNYIVTLTSTNACGSITTEFEVEIVLPPVANFSIETNFDCAPATIQFINESSPNTTEWFWTFDGGSPNTATVESPAITFNDPGTHTVTLTSSNSAGSSMFSINITLGGAPIIGFGSSVDDLTTTFTNQTMDAISFLWDFGDGNSSIEENPIHIYDEPRNYTVILSATNACGTTTLSQQVEVVGPQAVASFISSEVNGCLPFTVTFEDTSTGSPTAWNWIFPGGTPSTSTDQNPTVTYNSAGTFDVNLEVINPAGTSSIEQTSYITVDENPVADFTATVNMNGNVDFNNNSNFGDSFEWLFGDGNMSLENSPNHTYDTSGLYVIQLVVTNGCGTDTLTQEILIDITGIEDVTFLGKFDLYPNPNNGDFTLHLEGQPMDELEVSLYNILGQQIFREQIDFTSGQLIKDYKLSHLAAATYILHIRSDNQMIHRKVVKK
ncbi:MAG: PKD domain-containing protein [Saprospiraceae bacterium]